MKLNYDTNGLIPAVVQDIDTGAVLMVAWMNEIALQMTRDTGEAHFWSRRRNQLWHKGDTSGNIMHIHQILVDCDADTLLLQVSPTGAACHTGIKTCFFRNMD